MRLWISKLPGPIWEHAVSQCVHMLMRYESGQLEGEYLTPMCWRQSMEAVAFPPALGLFLITPSVSVRLLGPPQPRRSGKRREAFAKQLDDSKFNIPAPPFLSNPNAQPRRARCCPRPDNTSSMKTDCIEEVFKAHCCNSTDRRYSGLRILPGA